MKVVAILAGGIAIGCKHNRFELLEIADWQTETEAVERVAFETINNQNQKRTDNL